MFDLRYRLGRLPLLSVTLLIASMTMSVRAEVVLRDDAVTINGTTWRLNSPVPVGLDEDPSLGRNPSLPGLHFGLSERSALSLSLERERADSDTARTLLLDFRYHW